MNDLMPHNKELEKQIDEALLLSLNGYKWSNKTGSGYKWSDSDGFDITEEVDNTKQSLIRIINQQTTAARIDELNQVDPLTDDGTGSIPWELEVVARHIQKRLESLQAKPQ